MITKPSIRSQSIIKPKLSKILQCMGLICNTPLPLSIPKKHLQIETSITTPFHAESVTMVQHYGEGIVINNNIVVLSGAFKPEEWEWQNQKKDRLKTCHFVNYGEMRSGQLLDQSTMEQN